MKLLGGRYETLKPIASGGMATVHLGRAVGVGGFERLVAVKVMHPHIASDPDFVAMFLDEARLAARIRHPNVVATIDVQMDEAGLFLVMEFVDGPSLSSLQKTSQATKTRLPLNVVLRVMIDTLAGLHAAHELTDDEGQPLNLVHRDVTLANILVGVDGVVRITDFGVARAESRISSTRGGQLKGKIPYMPPEQLLGEQIDRRCDIYAAGAMLWELLVGKRLFHSDSDGRLVQMILEGPKHSPRELIAEVPEALDRVCMNALAAKPESRYATAAAFSEALEIAAEVAGQAIATSRAVAMFVERSGAHDKLDPKELAALKRAPAGLAPKAPPALPSSPSSTAASSPGTATSERSGATPISVPSEPAASTGSRPAATPAPAARLEGEPADPPAATHETSAEATTSEAETSAVTATEATISQVTEPARPARKRTTRIAVAALITLMGAAMGVVVLSGDGNDDADDDTGAAASTPTPPTQPSDDRSAPKPSLASSAIPTAASTVSGEASAMPTASTSATATAAAAPTPRRPPPAGPRRPPPSQRQPPPVSTSYNPDRL